ncbi:unnamed protein product [Eruca vesicaria subsp. sativa]|uniref:Uncharacterized protein n=1 Tax=Eruca vesicaria subsp. sativa TaxID=29727 RepID=A0ABC8LTM6_ERUVS|nr:unnamed protein product [Eruca vesicaria subsp. sativa]
MPQVDLEAFVCAGGSDRKIACSSTFSDDTETRPYYYKNSAVSPNDFPPESYFLSKDAQLEWLTDNAFFDRRESHRGNSVNNINSNPNSNPSSQRYSKASIIGLPKPQNTCLNEAKQRRNVGNNNKNLVFLKRVGSRTKRDLSQLEPSSPNVSCMGRVRSKRERSRRMRRQNSVRPEKANRVKKPGFMASFRAIFRIGGGCKHTSSRGTDHEDIRSRVEPEKVEPVAPGLGGMNRFASGRRGDLLGGC